MLSSCVRGLLGATLLSHKVYSNVPVLATQLQSRTVFSGGMTDPNFKTHKKMGRRKTKHHLPHFKKERAQKVIKVDLVDFHETNEDLTPQEIRMKMKAKGILPFKMWDERPMNISCTPTTFESYIPPESDGKLSIITKDGAKQKLQLMAKKGGSYRAVRRVQNFDEDFDIVEFAQDAQDIYIKAIKALADEDEDLLHELITERAYPLMTHETKSRTIRWQFIETLERPRAVYARTTEIISKENIFAQITVRMHTKQTLAVYDRFGRLMHGSEVVAKDVLEYVVFEKHVASTNGIWRVHDKIVPGWAPRPSPSLRTFRVKPEEEEEEAEPAPAAPRAAAAEPPPADGDQPKPAFA